MEFGVCIIALGYELYGTSALNLAISLKIHEPELKIALLCEPTSIKHLNEKELNYFDYLINVPPKEFENKNYFRVKLLLNDLSPFDKTIYLDADNIFTDKKISWLYGEVSQSDFFIGKNGQYDYKTGKKTSSLYNYWTEDEKACCDYHGINEILPQTISGFFYFEKTAWVATMFNQALKVYDDKNTPSHTWGGGKADEYCFNVALGKLNYKQRDFHCLYFDKLHGFKEPFEIYQDYFGIAMGGHRMSKPITELYDKMVTKYCEIEGLIPRYHVNKASVITERNKM